MKKIDFDKVSFYINTEGNGKVSGETVGVSKFYNNFLIWNKRFKPEKISKQFLKRLI